MKPPNTAEASVENKDTAFTIEDLPNKKFLGYDCFGKQMENEEYVMRLYVASERGVGMCNPFESESGNPGPAFRLQKKRVRTD